ncbi:hypothetical protein TRIUR3_11560 [Triticum urartu]|uniref:Uncharacterized protein n=1 Tax=Triticum urartu TaxID=4572 RepID=M7ZJE3_TRIUA|nr:hypothetical protein TRIUR3_11560 [Triticum urartu]
MAVNDTKLAAVADAENPAVLMAIGEYVSVCSQRDVEIAQLDLDGKRGGDEEKALPSPAQAAAASALAFSVGALVPLLAAGFIGGYHPRGLGLAKAVVLLGWGGDLGTSAWRG